MIDRLRTIVVTGADRGLGYELAKQYLERGDFVFAGQYRTKWTLLGDLKEKYPDHLHTVWMDVRSDESVGKAAAEILARTDAVDILINNAGVWLDHSTGTIFDTELDFTPMMEQVNVNAFGPLRVTHALLDAVLNSFDKLIANISSEAGSVSNCRKNDQFGYCISKAGTNMQSALIYNAIKPRGGKVVNLHPGWMQSVIGGPAGPDAEMVELPTIQDVKFYVTPAESAAGIIAQLEEPERFDAHAPAYINYRGDVMNY